LLDVSNISRFDYYMHQFQSMLLLVMQHLVDQLKRYNLVSDTPVLHLLLQYTMIYNFVHAVAAWPTQLALLILLTYAIGAM
jgi:hypothetical protein